MKSIILKIGCLIVAALWISSCDIQDEPSDLEDANRFFKQKEYQKALEIYLDCIYTDGSVARVGAGWCYLRLNNLGKADTMFRESANDSLADGLAGWSFTAWGLNQLDEAIARAYWVINKFSDFKMSLDTLVTARQLIWIQAASYFQKGALDESVERIRQIDPAFDPDMTAPNIADIILAKLEQLGNGQWGKRLRLRNTP